MSVSYKRFKEEKESKHECDCPIRIKKIFEACAQVNNLCGGHREREMSTMVTRMCVDNISQKYIFSLLRNKIMGAWKTRDPTKRKLYVGFLRKKDATIKVEPFVSLSPSVADPETHFQNSIMYQWVSDNSSALLTYLKHNSEGLSWKWERRGINKVILRIKPEA